ncbi:lipid droplet-associated protein [Mycolicibacterium sp. ELW1]|uniref:lipid droplet-associated protein n=1 Tax=Mycobacteriaceae TaxID=1762 RepID=UPI0011EFF7C9|nr:lipid droplet-associated protein [Mycobacterium sp. ELW1]QEN13026.1 lipid droplet-associated protein [Mycobacterium sp. ELW1]
MATAPYGVRLLVGAAVTAIEETRKLPSTILMYPMTVASNIAHIVMKVQQDLADLVIKGDSALENIFPPKDEQPEWATFDEDSAADDDAPIQDGERLTEGRFALYSTTDGVEVKSQTSAQPSSRATAPTSAPPIAEELDYESLTLAQLRARLQSLSVADLEALLAYEEASKSRAPFQTLLANRITRASAK